MKKALIVYDANADKNSFEVQTKLLFDASKKLGITLNTKSNVDIYTILNNNKVKSFESYANYDFALFLDSISKAKAKPPKTLKGRTIRA